MKRKKIQSLFDITIGQFQEIKELEEPTNIEIISILYKIPIEKAKEISKKQIDQEANNIRKVLMHEAKFIKKYK